MSFALALAIELALLIALLLWAPYERRKPDDRHLTTFSFAPDSGETEAVKPAQKATPKHSAASAASAAPPTPPPLPIPRPAPTTPPATGGLKGVLPIELGAADIGKLGHHDAGSDSGDSKAPYGPSEGPGGQPLYPVEWYREPTDAELNGYLPHGAPPGSWALIACQTAERYHVDNCRQLGEEPLGSGLARAMRLASWQFLVRPPRRGGQPIPRAWVKILISFGSKPAKSNAPPAPEDDGSGQ
ncbi:MAG: hypothetical protein J0I47_13865 [Sphingomonas sp.]|uniref:hypothetical protein n=1 Tax=Sphingomonas sp. TaxID=28214 RepID=UPI001AC89FC8|nr:hypothetical protein [Sphingomonas sp.]MBN8809304.1 hypothetical protein [Sphingomonas sp.]